MLGSFRFPKVGDFDFGVKIVRGFEKKEFGKFLSGIKVDLYPVEK